MLLVVAHHYVVNSGLTGTNDGIFKLDVGKTAFYLLFGAWGKTAINCFILITGYFMCKSQITVKKFVKLLAEVMFYHIVIGLIFFLTGYEPFSIKGFISMFFPVREVGQNFTGCFLIFYLFIPFLNILIHNIDEKKHLLHFGTLRNYIYLFWNIPQGNNELCFMVYGALYNSIIYQTLSEAMVHQNEVMGRLTALSIFVSVLSIACCAYFSSLLGLGSAYSFVQDSNTFLAITNGVCSFMFFNNFESAAEQIY